MTTTKKIGLPSAIGLTVGAMVGSAIFSLSGLTIAQSGAWSIFAWILAGLISLMFALVVAAFASKWSESDGGVYVYPKRVLSEVYAKPKFGNVLGFLTMWVYVVGCFAGVVFSCSYFAKYCEVFTPNAGASVAIIALILMLLLNLGRVTLTAHMNNILTVILAILMILFVIYAFSSPNFSINNFTIQESNNLFASITQSTPVAILAYGTIVVPAFLVGSIKNPTRNVPITMLVSMLIVVELYVFQLIALNGTMPSDFSKHPELFYTPYFVSIGSSQSMLNIISVGAMIALFTTGLVLTRLLITSLVQAFCDKDAITNPTQVSTQVGSSENRKMTQKSKIIMYFTLLILGSLILVIGGEVFEIVQLGAVLNLIYIGIICLCAFLMKEFSLKIRILALVVLIILLLCNIGSVITGGIIQLIYSLVVIGIGAAVYASKIWYTRTKS